jgi:hypothetical protein
MRRILKIITLLGSGTNMVWSASKHNWDAVFGWATAMVFIVYALMDDDE